MNLSRIFIIAALAVLPFSQASAYEDELKRLSQVMADKIAASNKSKVAVVDFVDLESCVTQLGRFRDLNIKLCEIQIAR
jgi:hypothetical protein